MSVSISPVEGARHVPEGDETTAPRVRRKRLGLRYLNGRSNRTSMHHSAMRERFHIPSFSELRGRPSRKRPNPTTDDDEDDGDASASQPRSKMDGLMHQLVGLVSKMKSSTPKEQTYVFSKRPKQEHHLCSDETSFYGSTSSATTLGSSGDSRGVSPKHGDVNIV